MESQLVCYHSYPWRLAWPQSLKQPSPPTSKATGKLYVQKAAQAADEAWQQTIGGLQGPSVTNPTVSALSLKSTLLSKGARQQVTRIVDLCHMHVSHKRLLLLGRVCGSVLTPHDYITDVQKRLGNRAWTGFGECRLCGSFQDP